MSSSTASPDAQLWNQFVEKVGARMGRRGEGKTIRVHAPSKSLPLTEQVARDIVRAMARGTPLLYTPGRWRWIMSIVCLIPAFVFNRLDI
jgi:hypothetical protein